MPYPPQYRARTDFALQEQSGEAVSGRALATELANVAETASQIIAFLKALATADKRWQPSVAVAQEMVQSAEYTATAGQTVFALPGGVTNANPASDFARVYIDGVRLAPSDVTLAAAAVTVTPALAGGETVIVELVNDYDTLRAQLASTDEALGASMLAVRDVLGQFTSADVEGALAELATAHTALVTALGTLDNYALLDGTRPWQADQGFAGFRLTDVGDGIDPQDVVTVAQLDALAAIYGDLANLYLSLAGGEMTGPIDMGGNKVTNLPVATLVSDAVRKDQVALLNGTQAFTAPISGVTAVLDAHLTTKAQVDAAIAAVSAALSTLSGAATLRDGSVPFTAPVGGVAATDPSHLVTKGQLDAAVLTSNAFANFSRPDTGQGLSAGNPISWPTRTVSGIADDSTTITIPADGTYAINANLAFDGLSSTTRVQLQLNGQGWYEYSGGVVTKLPSLLPPLTHSVDVNAVHSDADIYWISGTAYLTAGTTLRFYCTAATGATVYEGAFRVARIG